MAEEVEKIREVEPNFGCDKLLGHIFSPVKIYTIKMLIEKYLSRDTNGPKCIFYQTALGSLEFKLCRTTNKF